MFGRMCQKDAVKTGLLDRSDMNLVTPLWYLDHAGVERQCTVDVLLLFTFIAVVE